MRLRRQLYTAVMIISFSCMIVHSFPAVNGNRAVAPASAMTTFKVEPEAVSGGVDSSFEIVVNVYNASDLWGWQVCMMWNATVLGFSGLTFGNFLEDQPGGTIQLKNVEYASDGWLLIAEISTGRLSGVAGDGWLMSVAFNVLTFGETTLNIDSEYTFWHNSLLEVFGDDPGEMMKDSSVFHTVWPEDVNNDGFVDAKDVALIILNWCKCMHDVNPIEADVNCDNVVDITDLSRVGLQYGRHIRS